MSKKKVLTDQELAERKHKKAEYMKAWKTKNAVHVKQYNDAYFEENREYNKERCKAYKKANPEKIYQQNKTWNDNNRARRNELNLEWQRNSPGYRDRKFEYNLTYNYNITIEDYNRMLAAQGGHCATCPVLEPTTGRTRRFHVDHDHECCARGKCCGKCVRGLLCSTCNLTLGGIKDNIETLQNMIAYLKRTKWINVSGSVREQKVGDAK
jgi:recombination endonuclease VII